MFELKKGGELYFKDTPVNLSLCFPTEHSGKYISVKNKDGDELNFINSLDDLELDQSELIKMILKDQRVSQNIVKINNINDEIELRVFNVETTSGNTLFYTKLEDWPTKKANGTFIIRDINSDEYVLDFESLDIRSKKKVSPLID
jgi:hypothetical protein